MGVYVLQHGEGDISERTKFGECQMNYYLPLSKFLKNKICQTDHRSWMMKLFNEEPDIEMSFDDDIMRYILAEGDAGSN